jgi:lipopolysaccharide heptosyltransferase II
MNPEKILLIKLRAIGDVVMSTIVLDNLAAAFPGAAIDFLTEPAAAGVVLNHPTLRDVLILDRQAWKKQGFVQQVQSNISFLCSVRKKAYDLVFDFFGNPRSALITASSGAPIRVGYNYRIRQLAYNKIVLSRANEIHEADWHLDALLALQIPVVSRKLHVATSAQDGEFAEQFLRSCGWPGKKIVAINFFGGWPAKRWPLPRFAELADAIANQYDVGFIVTWGPGEESGAQQLWRMAHVPLQITPPTTLKQLAAILARVSLLVTTDSGPMHIAAAMNTPCVAIFGPTNPKLQGPYGNQHVVVRKEDLDCLCCNRLDCSHTSCMGQLSVQHVLDAVQEGIRKNGIQLPPCSR